MGREGKLSFSSWTWTWTVTQVAELIERSKSPTTVLIPLSESLSESVLYPLSPQTWLRNVAFYVFSVKSTQTFNGTWINDLHGNMTIFQIYMSSAFTWWDLSAYRNFSFNHLRAQLFLKILKLFWGTLQKIRIHTHWWKPACRLGLSNCRAKLYWPNFTASSVWYFSATLDIQSLPGQWWVCLLGLAPLKCFKI